MLSSCKPEVPQPNTYTVSFNSNGGSGKMESITGDEGSEITLEANTFTRMGYTFTEWNTMADESGDKYADEAKIKLTENTTLYAQWTANNYTVTFDANDADGDAPAEIQATYDKEFALPENTFTKIGYNFAGWNTKADYSGTGYEANAKVKNLTAENNATVILYAQWTERGTHKINYELNGGNHIDTSITLFEETEDVTLGTAERTGYTFGGWYEAEDFSGTAIAGWNAGEKTEDVTLYAKWTANTYTIKYELNGGTNADGNPTSYTIEDSITLKNPTKAGFTFVCWYSDRSKKTEIAKGSTGDIVLQAVWKNDADFVKVPAVSITGSETWKPYSNVFVKGRSLDIKAFWISDHEVTRGEYKEIMGSDPSTANAYDKDGNELTGDAVDNNPVNMVNWYDAIVYCNKRSIKEGLNPCYTINGSAATDEWGYVPPYVEEDTWKNSVICDFTANGYRLPTEAEWEWAARGGENYEYAGSDNINEVAWNNTNGTGTREVKTKKPNGYGLYDMSGNVWEWCWDWYGSISSRTPVTGASSGSIRVMRGGSWNVSVNYCGVAIRGSNYGPNRRYNILGFRLVRSAQ